MSGPGPAPEHIAALYFDGRSARGQPVHLRLAGNDLLVTPERAMSDGSPDESATALRWPLRSVRWPERTRHGQRVVDLPDGAQLKAADAAAFDAWRQGTGARDSWVVRAQQNWRSTASAALALVLLVAVGFQWGVPWAAQGLVAALPESVDRAVGESALAQIDKRWLKPTTLPAERQDALRQAFAHAVKAAYPAGNAPAYTVRFAAADAALGPNAFALPGGSIVVTDALVGLLDGADDTLVGVLGHELGHVQHRHGMKGVVQLALVGTATSVALGDFSTVLAGLPALLAQTAYSRDAEREADTEAARLLHAAGLQPAAMVVLFERLAKVRTGRADLPISLASHPMDEERTAFFRSYRP
jgi:Zn-dependent protease with chaperone function